MPCLLTNSQNLPSTIDPKGSQSQAYSRSMYPSATRSYLCSHNGPHDNSPSSPPAFVFELRTAGSIPFGPEYVLPTCQRVFNIFHPYDPLAFRLEPLFSGNPADKPLLVPHHQGRKRLHLGACDVRLLLIFPF